MSDPPTECVAHVRHFISSAYTLDRETIESPLSQVSVRLEDDPA